MPQAVCAGAMQLQVPAAHPHMLMLALLPIGLLALRCVEALAPRFGDLLFNFFVLRSACCSTCCSTLASLATAARPAAHPAAE